MSKLSFRARALDINKPLPIVRSEEEPDILNENVAISRSVPLMPTGMEKEEEEVACVQPLFALLSLRYSAPKPSFL